MPETLTEREKDAFLAEHAMGLKPRAVRARGSDCSVLTFHTCANGFNDGNWTVEELERYGGPPHFHTDPAAVFVPGGLVDAMEKIGWYLTLTNWGTDGTWSATFSRGPGEPVQRRLCVDESRMAAVAAAALKALEANA